MATKRRAAPKKDPKNKDTARPPEIKPLKKEPEKVVQESKFDLDVVVDAEFEAPEPLRPYKVVCHTKCFWLNTLWEPGDIYEGTDEPARDENKVMRYFSVDGKPPHTDKTIRAAGDDPRSTVEMLVTLSKKFGVEMPHDSLRVEVFEMLRKHEYHATSRGGLKKKQ